MKLTAVISSILVKFSGLALLVWRDFGNLQLDEQTWALVLAALGASKVAISAAPHLTRCAYDMIFEHLYVEYLYLKYPVAKTEKNSKNVSGQDKEGKAKTSPQETD